MDDSSDGKAGTPRLRRRAEKFLNGSVPAAPPPETEVDTLKLLHELQVHQVELEMQNEELQHSHEELRVSRDRYALLYDFAPVGYCTLDRDMAIRSVNLTGAVLLGMERSRLIKRRFCQFVADEYLATCANFLAKTFSDQGTVSCELALKAGKGRQLVVQAEAAAVGQGNECLVALVDITARKEAEAALHKSREELEQRVVERTAQLAVSADREREQMTGRLRALEELRQNELLMVQQGRLAAMGEMLDNIAHQWRQPMNYLGLLLQQIGLSLELGDLNKEQFDENLDRAMETLRHMSETIDDFRWFSAPDKAKKEFLVDTVVTKVLHLVEDNFKAQGIAIDRSATGAPSVNGYPNEYGQVLLNLLMNARDAFPESAKAGKRIRIQLWAEGGKAVLTVADNAGGIDDRIMDRIFDAYFTTKELGKGTGIGLFLSKMIIEKNMGGRITVRNVAKGAEFRIEV
ncbi:PAS domain S-box protein [Oryzomonas sagensis]|uniref:histidine kinase n=1 Tax=Oryzomonas sagensis TaxID=2603857 RepID=A0ABQ6TPY3_9BACT|nr:ATP-binding protein [Oryzomonas sagensis]KAB0670447.1 PAS domain S-box protein [Oryzomonas sagensis]